jgi:acyl-CoA thioesterase
MAEWERDTRVDGSGGHYRARLKEEWAVWGPNGGYRAAIALRAIGAEAGLPRPASFHCKFLAGGRFAPVDLEVVPLVRRKRAEAWRCSMSQDGEPLLETTAWVVDAGLAGYEHLDATMPEVRGPEDLQGYQDLADNYDEWYPIWRSMEGRPVDWGRDTGPPRWHTWLRFFDTPPLDEPFLEASRTVMWMDTLPWNALIAPHSWPHRYLAPNLDLSVQFHQFAPDAEWTLCDGFCPVARDGLGGCTGRLWTSDGRLVASGASQLLCRPNPTYERDQALTD